MNKAIQLTGLSQPELISFVETLGEPAYRGRQLFAALQHRRLRSFDEMTDLPKELRARLNELAQPATLKVESQYVSSDGTRRYLMKTHDGLPVETVLSRKNAATRSASRHNPVARYSARFVWLLSSGCCAH